MASALPEPGCWETVVVYSPSPWRQGPSSPAAGAGSRLRHAPDPRSRRLEEGQEAKMDSDLGDGSPQSQSLRWFCP